MFTFWVTILALTILLYGLLHQFNLGVSILVRSAREDDGNRALANAVAPLWHGNEIWVIAAGLLSCIAFPVVCATLLTAFYLPFLLMLAGLILRGTAAEHGNQSRRPPLWRAAFSGGSFVAALMQGLMLGALVEGLIIARGEYSRDQFAWWSLLAVLCGGGGLVLGYALLGAFWLVRQFAGNGRTAAYRVIPALALGALLALIFVFVYSLAENLRVMGHSAAARAAYPHVVLDRSPTIAVRPRLDRS